MSTKKTSKKSHKVVIVLLILFLLGAIGFFAFPYISDFFIKNANEDMLSKWNKEVLENPYVFPDKEVSTEDAKAMIEREKALSPLYQALCEYNEMLVKTDQSCFYGNKAWEREVVNLYDYDFSEPVFGSLSVKSLGITYPICFGATESNMLKGATHLYGTSAPIGGVGSHCVICGHCGMMRTEMFRHLDKVVAGDIVTIKNPWETLTYIVTEIIICQPEDYSRLLIEEGKDLLTLVTCYPYPDNSQRLLVRCERVLD